MSSSSQAQGIPIPPAGDLFATLHASCAQLAKANNININLTSAKTFLSSTLTPELYADRVAHSFHPLPLRFDSQIDHINLLAVRALLNFGSGYRAELKQLTGRGAWDNIQFLVLAMHLDAHPLDAQRMHSVTASELAMLANVPTHIDAPSPIAGVTVSEPSPLVPFLNLLAQTLNDTGKILLDRGFMSLGQFVMSTIGQSRSAATLLAALASTFPAFRDVASLPGAPDKPVYLLKKAQFLAMDRYFSLPNVLAVQWVDIADVGIPSDNVIPSVLVHLGILELPADFLPASHDGGPITVSFEKMAALRAASVHAVKEMTPMLQYEPKFTVVLGSVIWAWAKVGDNRAKIPRLTLKDTCMF
ncbi:hypothetical protein BCR44DRAFT_1442544 [Catenaria anguillulae PL171]|uniref:Queuosine 5'-phosphate N-glycosylase/hydrolase n=1 Tax=Catenaria anguillulae PL171 TaxID=765915 RepID=A0A1Y2H9L4_9FUNG|nr:hypothetical protein BCR44DRAFT_1442544 [Catenaria anguillulae PL171]